MIDIDVEGDRRYGVIEQGSRAHRALRQLRTDLITARLSSEDGERPYVNAEHVKRVLEIKTPFWANEISHLVRIGVLDAVYPSDPVDFRGICYGVEAQVARSCYQFIHGMGNQKGFALSPIALDALNQLRDGSDYVRFPFP